MTIQQHHVAVTAAAARAVELLAEVSQLPKQRIKVAMQRGAVWLTRAGHTARLRRASRSLRIGDELHLYYNDSILREEPVLPRLVADERCYSVWDKPSGLRSQGSKWGDHCTVVRCAERNLEPQRTAYTVHRLDRAATGLIVVAHAKSAAANLSQQFRERRVRKRYRAVVHGDFSVHATALRLVMPLDGKSADSECQLVTVLGDHECSVVDVTIKTGRKHQIRRHLAGAGFPIVGDRLYGSAASTDVDLQLRAIELGFSHPIDERSVVYRLATNDGNSGNLGNTTES
ncbi:MAG: RNA pseudouridine synthase [Pseudomonadota bacterium]